MTRFWNGLTKRHASTCVVWHETVASMNEYAQSTAERYYNESSELRSYLNLAYSNDPQENVNADMDHDKILLFIAFNENIPVWRSYIVVLMY